MGKWVDAVIVWNVEIVVIEPLSHLSTCAEDHGPCPWMCQLPRNSFLLEIEGESGRASYEVEIR